MDDLETQLISEADDQDERKELKTKIIDAKIKRMEKVAEMSIWIINLINKFLPKIFI